MPARTARNRGARAGETGDRLFAFHGGLSLPPNKAVSCRAPLQQAELPDELFVPLLQHTGREAEPTVDTGETVLKGQQIGCYSHLGRGCVHAPTSGTVTAIVRHPISHPSGQQGLCVVIRPDGLDRWKDLEPIPDWQGTDPGALRERIRNSGIVGLGGALFPTGFKLREAHRRGIHTLILNGSECEPFISCDETLMREQPHSIVLGARILQRAVGARQTIIAIEDQAGGMLEQLEQAAADSGDGAIRVVQVMPVYPEGGEKQLIKVLTGREVPSGGRPADLGVVCQNVATATAAARAVVEGKPLVERIVTVTGAGVKNPRNLVAAIGTPISNLIEQCGGYAPDAARLVLGGPMMGFPLASDDNPVTKAANCVLVLTDSEIRDPQPEMPCIRCGDCAQACPAMLLPQQLHRFVRAQAWDDAAGAGLADCIECGCCDFVCPSHIPLANWFRFGKSRLREKAKDEHRADTARARFEARKERQERIQLERSKRTAARKAVLNDDAAKKARVAEAVERARKKQEPGS